MQKEKRYIKIFTALRHTFNGHTSKIAVMAVVFSFALFLSVFHSQVGIFIWNEFHLPRIALALNPDARFAKAIGDYYFNQGGNGDYKPETAKVYYQKALSWDPMAPDAWHQMSRIDFVKGDMRAAYDDIDKQIALHGDSLPNSYYMRGLIEGYIGNLDGAQKDFQRALEVGDSRHWATHNDLAWIYFLKGDFASAERIAAQGLSMNPGNPWLLNSLGTALLNEGKGEEAKKILAEAQTATDKLTVEDWRRAYPGNDPKDAPTKMKAMQDLVAYNLALADTSGTNRNAAVLLNPDFPLRELFRFAFLSPSGVTGGFVIAACGYAEAYYYGQGYYQAYYYGQGYYQAYYYGQGYYQAYYYGQGYYQAYYYGQ
ncbi:MAG: tetratricopeptide repeat protein, partial [bacterium]|nr:tetratricopeptide repeat protein [bacterium]